MSGHFETIIVGVDFSSYSSLVMRQAQKLAQTYHSRMVVVHAISPMVYANEGILAAGEELNYLTPTIKEITSFYKIDPAKDRFELLVEIGSAQEVLIEAAKKYPNPLIVVGHKGHSNIARFFLGSTAESLALRSPAPVWIHRGHKVQIPKKILLPCDFSERSTASFQMAAGFSNGRPPELEFFHVRMKPALILDPAGYRKLLKIYKQDEDRKIKDFQTDFPDVPMKSHSCGAVGDVVHAIANESKKFDLIAMAPHNRKGLFASFGSVTSKVVRAVNKPILITR